MTNDGGVVARGTSKGTTVTRLLLNVANDGTLWQRADGQNVADVQGGLLSTVDELASVHTLSSDEGLDTQLVAVWVAEGDTSERSTSVM